MGSHWLLINNCYESSLTAYLVSLVNLRSVTSDQSLNACVNVASTSESLSPEPIKLQLEIVMQEDVPEDGCFIWVYTEQLESYYNLQPICWKILATKQSNENY